MEIIKKKKWYVPFNKIAIGKIAIVGIMNFFTSNCLDHNIHLIKIININSVVLLINSHVYPINPQIKQ